VITAGKLVSSGRGISAFEMRNAMGQFATGVTVVTALDASGAPVGCTVSAFSSLSLDPPLVLVCVDKRRLMHSVLSEASSFAINILSKLQADVALNFARPTDKKFEILDHHAAADGSPLIDGAITHIECNSERQMEGGDHTIFVGRVMQVRVSPGEPLLYSQGAFVDVMLDASGAAIAYAPYEWLLDAPW
jgi:flavin reductase (DIM6/NTAB) family NADH-FMN oxidoreductase RutF